MEPGTTATVTAKFKNVPVDEALSRLLARVNYSECVTNGIPRLLVYRTVAGAATQAIEPPKLEPKKEYRIPNELIIRLKRNSRESIDDIARRSAQKSWSAMTVSSSIACSSPTNPPPPPPPTNWRATPRLRLWIPTTWWILPPSPKTIR